MENLSSPNLVPEPVLSQVSAPVPTQQNNRSWLIIAFSFITLLLLASTGYLYYQNQQLKSMVANYHAPEPSSTPLPTTNPVVNSQPGWKTYTDGFNKYLIQYPSAWTYTTKVVPKGPSLINDPGHYSINPEFGDVEVTRFTKGKYEIELTTKTVFTATSCGGINGFYDANAYKNIGNIGTDVYRVKLEDGKFWAGGDEPDPHPQPILFSGNKDFEYQFCIQDSGKTAQVSIVYYSSDFTQANIEAKRLDFNTIMEMDKIISTFKFTQ